MNACVHTHLVRPRVPLRAACSRPHNLMETEAPPHVAVEPTEPSKKRKKPAAAAAASHQTAETPAPTPTTPAAPQESTRHMPPVAAPVAVSQYEPPQWSTASSERGPSPVRVVVRLSPPPKQPVTHPMAPRLPEPHEVEAARLPRDVFDRLRQIMLTPSRWRDEGDFRVCTINVGSVVSDYSHAAFIMDSVPRSYEVSMDKSGLLTIKYRIHRVEVTAASS